jgi:hypothetical protein
MNKLFRLVKRGRALTHIVTGKREAIPSEQVVLGARASIKDLEWYLTDNISEISVRGLK